MGLGSNGNGKIFVNVVNGMMAVRVNENTPGAVSRVLTAGINQGKMVYEKLDQYLEGNITNLTYEVSEQYGSYIKIEIENKYVLSVPFKSSTKKNVICQLPNVDFTQPVHIRAFLDKKNVKKNVLLIHQSLGGATKKASVPFAHTNENPNGRPDPIETTELGVKKLDWSGVENFYYGVLQQQITRFNEANGIVVDEEPSEEDFN